MRWWCGDDDDDDEEEDDDDGVPIPNHNKASPVAFCLSFANRDDNFNEGEEGGGFIFCFLIFFVPKEGEVGGNDGPKEGDRIGLLAGYEGLVGG